MAPKVSEQGPGGRAKTTSGLLDEKCYEMRLKIIVVLKLSAVCNMCVSVCLQHCAQVSGEIDYTVTERLW